MSPLKAFRKAIAYSEGTDKEGQPTKCQGYDVIVGGALFSDFSKHPGIYVKLPNLKITSSAAGRYQILEKWAKAYIRQLKLPDFGPNSQDAICDQLIRECKAMGDVLAGRFELAIEKCASRWASLPGAGYGQHEHKISTLRAVYDSALAE